MDKEEMYANLRSLTALGMTLMRGGIVELQETDERHTIEEWHAIDAARPWWKRVIEEAWTEVEWRGGKVRYEVRQRWQKLTTGTNSREWAALDSWLTKELGMRLRVMAQKTQSFPVDYTPEEWVLHLDTLGRALQAYDSDLDWDVENWLEVEAANKKRAKEALQWITDNLEMLWS
jgi:hypothetical protein